MISITIVFTSAAILAVVHGQKPVVVVVGTGKTANLTYPAPVTTDAIVCWRNQQSIRFTGRYGLVTNPDGSINITISQVTTDDKGGYICQKNPGVIPIVIYSLIVVDPIVMSVDQTIYNLGDKLVVTCSATFYLLDDLLLTPDQDLNLILMHNGDTLWTDNTTATTVSSTRKRTLSFTGTALESMRTNNITCVLKNNYISESVSQRVYITYPPTAAKIDKSRNVFSPGEVLVCTGDGYPIPTSIWRNVNYSKECVTLPAPTSMYGIAFLNLTDSCLGLQTWTCTVTWPVNNTGISNLFQFKVVSNNTHALEAQEEAERKKQLDIGLGVGLGLGIPLLLIIIGLILVFCCGVGRGSQSSQKKAQEVKKSQPPPTTTRQGPSVVVNKNVNHDFQGLPSYSQVGANGTGTSGMPDIGVSHLSGSGSIPQLNSSLDGPNFNFKADKGGANVNLGKADLGYQNRSFTNI